MNAYDIIKRPLNTEKASILKDQFNKVTFEVDGGANRIEIRKSVEHVFKVKVKDVRTIQVKGKRKQRGRITGKRRDWKKAVVTLMPGESIDIFEGV